MTQIRQGDLLFIKNYSAHRNFANGMMHAKVASPLQVEDGRIVLARGEKTGHSHTIAADAVQEGKALTIEENELFLQIVSEVKVQHQEHEAVTLPPGNWSVLLQREHSGRLEKVQTERPRPRFQFD